MTDIKDKANHYVSNDEFYKATYTAEAHAFFDIILAIV